MPIYKVGNVKKDGLQKYHVRINYITDYGEKKQITRAVYGIDVAKDLERKLEHKIKVESEIPINQITVRQLFDEYISIKKYEVRESSLDKTMRTLKKHIEPTLANVRIDKLSTMILQEWKVTMEEKNLALKTRKNTYR